MYWFCILFGREVVELVQIQLYCYKRLFFLANCGFFLFLPLFFFSFSKFLNCFKFNLYCYVPTWPGKVYLLANCLFLFLPLFFLQGDLISYLYTLNHDFFIFYTHFRSIIACRLLGHKIQSPQEREALQALVVVEACVKNCGEIFHKEIGKFRFLNEMIKLVSPKVSVT